MLIARLIKPDTELYRKISERVRVLDIVFLLKPTFIFPVWIMIAAGMSAAMALAVPEFYWLKDISWKTALYFLGLTLMAGSAILSVQVKNHLTNPADTKRMVVWLVAAGLVITAAVSVTSVVSSGGWAPLMALGESLLAVAIWTGFQSGGPFLGGLVLVLTGFLLFFVGWTYASGPLGLGLFHAGPYVLFFSAVLALTPLAGQGPDGKGEKKALLPSLGAGTAAGVGTAMVTGAMVMGFFLDDPVSSTGSILSLPFFILALIFSRTDHITRAVRYPVLIMAILVSVRFPWLFVALFSLYYFSKVYTYFRYNIDYPTFHVERVKDGNK